METKEITVTYKRTYNLGNYESVALSFSAVVIPDGTENTATVARKVWESVIGQVHTRAAGIREAVTVETKAPPETKTTTTKRKPGEYDGEFAATSLIAEVSKGKTFWKLTDVPGTKYDVNIWPEVAKQEYGDLDELDPMQTYDLTGWTARFINKEDSGYPWKITKLWRAGGVSPDLPPEDEVPF